MPLKPQKVTSLYFPHRVASNAGPVNTVSKPCGSKVDTYSNDEVLFMYWAKWQLLLEKFCRSGQRGHDYFALRGAWFFRKIYKTSCYVERKYTE